MSKTSNISIKKSRRTGFGVCIPHAMTGDRVTQPAFSCISFERQHTRFFFIRTIYKNEAKIWPKIKNKVRTIQAGI